MGNGIRNNQFVQLGVIYSFYRVPGKHGVGATRVHQLGTIPNQCIGCFDYGASGNLPENLYASTGNGV
jgi:hypothetical protein